MCFLFALSCVTLSDCVWTRGTCVFVCMCVCAKRSSEVEWCQCQCSPSLLTLSWWLPAKCLHPSDAAPTQTQTHEDLTFFKCKGNSTVSVKGEANRMGNFKCLPWVTTSAPTPPPPPYRIPSHTHHLLGSGRGSQHVRDYLRLTGFNCWS